MIALLYIGCLITIVASIFKTSVLWGLGCLIVPFVSLIFVFLHWQAAKAPFLWSLLGIVLMVIPLAMHPELTGRLQP
jgi:hypothetical protein